MYISHQEYIDVHQLNDVHLSSEWFNSVHQASLWHDNLWLNAVQALIYGPKLYGEV